MEREGFSAFNKSFSTYELKVGHEGLSESNAEGNQQLLQWMKFGRKEFPIRCSMNFLEKYKM